jgi:DNA-binding NarL/FixJ family response regulator
VQHPVAARVLLVDDHPLVRAGLKTLIESQPDLLVVGEAASEEEALRIVRSVSAEVALVDVSLPGSGGARVTERLVSAVPAIRVIAVTRHTDEAFVAGMIGAGAWGYVLKQSASSELLRAIRLVAAGHRFIDPALQRTAEPASSHAGGHEFRSADAPLTSLEEQVLRLIAEAHSNQDIAGRLGIRISEVAELKSTAMKKAGLISRMHVIAYAQSRGWNS